MEQRREKRVAPRELEPVEVQIMGDGFIDILYAKDIGKNGLGIHVPKNYMSAKVKCEVNLIISLPGCKSFDASGVIKHAGRIGADSEFKSFGIHFTRINPQHRGLLENYFQKIVADNRRHVRVVPSPENPVRVHATINDTTEVFQVKDIGIGGVGLAGGSSVPDCSPDEAVNIIIALPTGEKVQVKGSFKYSNQANGVLGLCFRELAATDAQRLKQYIAERVRELQKKIDYS